jgi:hypothetical protein
MFVFRAVIALTAVMLLEFADNAGAATISACWNDVALNQIRQSSYDSTMAAIDGYDAFAKSSVIPIRARDSINNVDAWQPDAQRGLVAQEGSTN